jgi:hypothetical protein
MICRRLKNALEETHKRIKLRYFLSFRTLVTSENNCNIFDRSGNLDRLILKKSFNTK